METRTRSLIKAVMWQMLGLAVMTLVGLAMTGSIRAGGSMAVVNAVLGLSLYLLYERLWQRVRWGRIEG